MTWSLVTSKSSAVPVNDSVTSVKMVKCEVLYFIQNKCFVLPFDSNVSICSDFHNYTEPEEAENLLPELLPHHGILYFTLQDRY